MTPSNSFVLLNNSLKKILRRLKRLAFFSVLLSCYAETVTLHIMKQGLWCVRVKASNWPFYLTNCALIKEQRYLGQDDWNCPHLHLQAVWRNHLCVVGLSGGANNDHLAVEVYWLLAFDQISITLSRLLSLFAFFLLVPCSSLFIIFFSCPRASCSCCPPQPARSYISMWNAFDWRKNKQTK